jgi:anti-sigma B factor antagonist
VPFAEPRLTVQEQDVDAATTVVAVAGEIHVSSAPELRRALQGTIDAGRVAMVLDLTAVEFIDSTGLGVLLDAQRRVTRADGRLAVVCTNPTVMRLFEITRLDETFAFHHTVASALTAVQTAGGRTAGAP